MDTVLSDIRSATLGLLRTPWFTVFAASTLALGIGSNVVIYSVARRVLLDPEPFPSHRRFPA